MADRAIAWAFRLKIRGPRKAVLVALAQLANDDNGPMPPMDRLILFSGFKERTIKNAIQWLEDNGLINTVPGWYSLYVGAPWPEDVA
jgi:hypothetical protein